MIPAGCSLSEWPTLIEVSLAIFASIAFSFALRPFGHISESEPTAICNLALSL